MPANTDQLMNDARCIQACVPDGEKLAVLISVFYQLLQNGTGGGGGSGATQVFANNYAGGVPTDVPTTAGAIAFDTSTGQQWNWWSGSWH